MSDFLSKLFQLIGMLVLLIAAFCVCYFQDPRIRLWVDSNIPEIKVYANRLFPQSNPNESALPEEREQSKIADNKTPSAASSTQSFSTPISPVSPPVNTAPSKTNATQQTAGDFSKYSRFLVTIEGDKAIGSGFLVSIQNRAYVPTNAHVLSGNEHLIIRTIDGTVLHIGGLFVAKNIDFALLQTDYSGPFLPICQSFANDVQMNDMVRVLGNSEGAGVATDLTGKIIGVGPDRIEVDAQFVEGNSGSPVILDKTGEAVGIASYSLIPDIEEFANKSATVKDSPFWKIRRFAYRLDAAGGYDSLPLSTFAQEASYIDEFNENTENIYLLAADLAFNNTINVDWHNRRYNHLAIPIQEYVEESRKSASQSHNSMDARQLFLTRLDYECTADINLYRRFFVSTYHIKELGEIETERDQLKHLIDRLLTQ